MTKLKILLSNDVIDLENKVNEFISNKEVENIDVKFAGTKSVVAVVRYKEDEQ